MVRQAVIGDIDASSIPTKRRYGLTNVIVTPSKYRRTTKSCEPFMQFELGQTAPILIRRERRYRELERALKAQQGYAVTGIAETMGEEQEIDWLCRILSLGQGSIINWIWREDYLGRKRVRTVLENRVTRPYSNIHPLPIAEPRTLPDFAVAVYRRFKETFEPFRLNAVIRLLSDARYGRDSDLESRGLMLVTVLELLAGAYGHERQMAMRMPAPEYGRGRKTWKPLLEQALTQAYPGRYDIQQMLANVSSSLNRISFRERLYAMTQEFKLPSGDTPLREQVDKVVRVRNKLVHEARFPSYESPADQFFFLMAFVDRLILRFLGYCGKYMAFKDGGFRPHDLS